MFFSEKKRNLMWQFLPLLRKKCLNKTRRLTLWLEANLSMCPRYGSTEKLVMALTFVFKKQALKIRSILFSFVFQSKIVSTRFVLFVIFCVFVIVYRKIWTADLKVGSELMCNNCIYELNLRELYSVSEIFLNDRWVL